MDEPTRGTSTQSHSGHGGIYAILIIIVILLVGGFIFLSGGLGEQDSGPDLEIELPAPDVDVETPSAPGGDGGGG